MMLLKAIGISLIILSGVGLLMLGIQIYSALPEMERTIIGAISVFSLLVTAVYLCLWLEKDGRYPDYDDEGEEC